MKYQSVFDIIGPVMVGPSSSHTAGAARIGRAARLIFGIKPTWATVHLYGSFAKTYRGHGTDLAIAGGLLGYDTDDDRIRFALETAEKHNMKIEFIEDTAATEHPNTARIKLGTEKSSMELVGVSIGGGKVEITELNGFELRMSGNKPAILIMHNDRFGAIASVTQILAQHEINIAHMEVSRKDVGKDALMVIETDQNVEDDVMQVLEKASHINRVSRLMN
ncbi:L-serine ammonia-lyase, iron-sulfur-dependent subunit beta [Terribacillus saccharophilus]|uniref:L-serine deaminase n=1 Tax=Terribacillus saccharophilus TaxID=361277 RepID=A0A268AAB1_9BACI|nr:L-serine ammonia-lyase, iron-sulfur-dependent subunit beta [Terribacillus saccharophilus]PAD21063.1 L-serine ammonia-lyase, iron-sulfur-dependent, subunit beta [Terribacillus saccharophilus]PAF17376.1 L-serine ammonia-lyase, iron-sulfur-dependent, subunit beta [Terribacillus saccharophilus]PAF22144.1 L-serine ammonia-lyase, iron-sulfur-dependent, subunit beta [Terribacillus saccharophilus]PAF38337.1 L-serine ammonia-lyase, iron-sulfur-dependent, subunit beta [Terribacillus saccharophilus]PA